MQFYKSKRLYIIYSDEKTNLKQFGYCYQYVEKILKKLTFSQVKIFLLNSHAIFNVNNQVRKTDNQCLVINRLVLTN